MAGGGFRRRGTVGLAVLMLVGGLAPECDMSIFTVRTPAPGLLTAAGDVPLEIATGEIDPASVRVLLDGSDVTGQLTVEPGVVWGILPGVPEGDHQLEVRGGGASQMSPFETVDLVRPDFDPDQCELLNGVTCLLPYPSSRFLALDPTTPSGRRLEVPQIGIPQQNGEDIPAAIFRERDGFTIGAQVLMHFPAGVDLAASGASRLQESLQRSTDLVSVAPDSPSLLIDWETGEQLYHWLENDVRGEGKPDKRALILRPGRILDPERRYIVALRNLVDDAGQAVEAEPVFDALRDERPSDIPAVEGQRPRLEEIFGRLAELGVSREELVLAFDFHTASDENLTGQMLSMRYQSFAWLVEQTQPTFSVDSVEEFDCSQPGQRIWKEVRGTFQVPLFLTSDPETDILTAGTLRTGADGFTPLAEGVTHPPYGISISCLALEPPEERRIYATVLGHGLFGNGPDFAIGVAEGIADADDLFGVSATGEYDYITGGTSWRGLSDQDIAVQRDADGNLLGAFIINLASNLETFPGLPDRLRQGQNNQLVLARMMKLGLFNAHPAFKAPAGHGVFRPGEESFYFGASLGGVMGLMFAALSPDVVNVNADVPSFNFNCLLQRATPFIEFQLLLDLTIGPDPLKQILGLGLVAELWTTGESVGYAGHITRNPLPGTNTKKMMLTAAWLDQQVSNQCTEITARTLGIPMLEGSLLSGLPQIPDAPGPLESAFVVTDTGGLDSNDPAQQAANIIPPLANALSDRNRCDPHARRQFIPASLRQLSAFLRPGGQVENFCDGICDADPTVVETGPQGDVFATEMPDGDPVPCDPLPSP